ncbi:hypothetical protein [Neobacillus sp. OS1-33]|jgi:hypothetical protein|uniref:hypothetical protein n=1 Tax=Neobacillus sp. OS1-33 TaxID=3070683 RepID=UPI0027DFA776|nr:hypothetical protein [Neobacillus sp. OS1-33]WML27368.1 hypothetical protein RCG22_07060 [Neobacillus sp. OS1-33]
MFSIFFGFLLLTFFPFDLRSDSVPQRGIFSPFASRTKNTHRQSVKGAFSTKVFYVAIAPLIKKFLPLDRLTSRLSFQLERFGCPTGWKLSRLALFYDSEGKREKYQLKQALAWYPLIV